MKRAVLPMGLQDFINKTHTVYGFTRLYKQDTYYLRVYTRLSSTHKLLTGLQDFVNKIHTAPWVYKTL